MTDRYIQKDRLKEIVKDSLMKHIDKTCSLAENITNDLLANGVIVPPCKVGDTVYTNYNHLLKKNTDEIFECKVVFIGFYEDGNYINLVDNYEHLHSMDFETFSKTVFLTKEEAEEKLKQMKG